MMAASFGCESCRMCSAVMLLIDRDRETRLQSVQPMNQR